MIANPTIPDGWSSYERGDGHSTAITRPIVGGVTIDWKSRCAFPGYGRCSVRPILSGDKYKGRGWQERLLADAVAWLEGLK